MKFIVIVKCENPNAWYASKIGTIFKIEESVNFEKEYTIKLDNKKNKSPYGFVLKEDAELINPSFWQKVKMFFGF